MAGQKSDKGKTPKKKSGGMMGLASKIVAVLAIALAALFFAAVFDVGHIGLHYNLKGLAIALVPLYALLAIAALFITPKAGGDNETQVAQIAALNDFQSRATSQILALQNQFDSLGGQDNESLKARVQELEAELNAIHQAERDKVEGEIEALRQRNEELEEQIKKWAFEAVGKSVNGEQVEAMEAA